MSEEIKNSGKEVNEKELEGVSGGYHLWDAWKERYCDRCDHRDCGKDYFDLYDYINEGHRAPAGYHSCPFY